MTHTELERLAVLETQFRQVQSDVTEIKSDVKTLVHGYAELSAQMATAAVDRAAHEAEQARVGTWVRSIVPWMFSLLVVIIAAANFISEHIL